MIINDYDQAQLSRQFGIDIGNIEELDIPSGWGKIAPGQCSASHQHDEIEMFVIISGEGNVIVDSHYYPVKAGTVVKLDSFESHVLENTGSKDIVFFLQYYRDSYQSSTAASSKERQNPKRPQFVFSTPPTPNGDLHLGHLSGPYLGADAYVRYQRLLGNPAWHITGSDDYQSYVASLAKDEESTPEIIAAHYSKEILETLSMMDINVDQYTATSQASGYKEGTKEFFTNTLKSGHVILQEAPSLVDASNGEYLYESSVSGGCPGCGNSTNGNICEECGEPNVVVDLSFPKSIKSKKKPKKKAICLYILPLHKHEKTVQNHHKIGRVPARVRELAARVFSKSELNIPLTHISEWGISPKEKGGENQVIWVWPEMSYGFLYGIETLGKRLNQPWKANQPSNNWKIVHFFGYDNSFYHSILYPIIYSFAYPKWKPDIDYHCNEFYLLEGKKFSTSRRHAIWGKEILTPETVDGIRYYLSLTRPEKKSTNFQIGVYQDELQQTLIGVWQHWLHNLGQRVNELFDGIAPGAGTWTKEHMAFWAQLNGHLKAMSDALNPDGFSLRRAAKQLRLLVEDTVEFSQCQQSLKKIKTWKDEYRTTIALELAAAKLLSCMSTPIMPRFSERLATALGNKVTAHWPLHAELVEPGQSITLNSTIWFEDPENKENEQHWNWVIEKLQNIMPEMIVEPDETLGNLGFTSLMTVTFQYYLLNDLQVDISFETILNKPLNTIIHAIELQVSETQEYSEVIV